MTLHYVIAGVVGYLLGCISFANLIARRHGVADLRATGDRNPGYWNARSSIGIRASVPILLLDAAKAAAAVGVGLVLAGTWGGIIAWFAVVIGHMFPVTMRFRGGRSVLCLVGGALVLVPLACIPAAIALLLVRWRWDFARGAQAALIAAPFAVWVIYGAGPELFATVALLCVIGVRSALADRALKRAGIDKNRFG
ncbi:MAG: glycerol-3-phosphate acyltransferase [Thermoleophilia bacterium]